MINSQQITYSALYSLYFSDVDILKNFTLFPAISPQPSPLYFNACGLSYAGGSQVFNLGLYNYAHITYFSIPPHYLKRITLTVYKSQAGDNHFYLNLGSIGQSSINYYYLSTTPYFCSGKPIYFSKIFNITDNLDSSFYIDFGVTYNSLITDVFGFRDFNITFYTCIPNCLNCSDGITCNICDTFNNYGLNTNQCCSLCPIGTYADSISNLCVSCANPCQTCNGLTESHCLSCLTGYYLLGNACNVCHITCLTCYGPNQNQCNSCYMPLLLTINTCNCPSGTYFESVAKNCLICIEPCQLCTENANNCLTCINSYYLQNNLCWPCDSLCFSCSGPNKNQCNSCNSLDFLQNGQCVSQCNLYTYEDLFNRICIDCDSSCETCFSFTNESCFSCYDGTYLYKSSCSTLCPIDYYEMSDNNTCMPVEIINDTVKFSNTNIHLLELYLGNNYSFIDINFLIIHISLQLIVNTRQLVVNSSSNLSYDITQNSHNSQLYYIIPYYENEQFITSLNISFNENNDKNISFLNKSYVFQINSNFICPQNQYFSNISYHCIEKSIIQYSVGYTDEPYIILLSFNSMTSYISQSILQGLLIFYIDNMTPLTDYNYTMKLETLSLYINFAFNTSVIGKKYLHIMMNQSIYFLINVLDTTIYLLNQNSSIKLIEYYLLTNQQNQIINQTKNAVTIGNWAMEACVYLHLFLMPCVLSPIMGMLLLNMIEMLKYIQIDYPPNVMMIFQQTSFNIFVKSDFIPENQTNLLPPLYYHYNLKNSIINNLAESYMILFGFILLSIVTKLILLCQLKNSLLVKILNQCKQRFVWNILVMLFLSKFMNTSFSLLLYLRYQLNNTFDNKENSMNFPLLLFCFAYVVIYPIHMYKTLKNLISILSLNTQNKTSNKIDTVNNKTEVCFKKNSIYPIIIEPDNRILSSNNMKTMEVEESKEKKIDLLSKERKFDDKPSIKYESCLRSPKHCLESNKIDDNIYNGSQHESNDQDLISSKPESSHDTNNIILIKSSKVSLKSAINWKNLNEYTTPTLRKSDSFKKDVETSLALDISNDRTDNSNLNVSIKKKASKFKELTNEEKTPIKPFILTPIITENINLRNKEEKTTSIVKYGLVKTYNSLIILLKYLLNIYKIKDNDEYIRKYSVLCQNFSKPDFLYNILFDISRFFIIPFVIVILYGVEILQISILNLINFLMIGYLMVKKPYKSKPSLIISLINEFCIFISYLSAYLLAALAELDLSVDTKMNFGWIIVFAYIFLLYFLIINTLLKILKGLGCKRKKKINKVYKE